MRTSTAAIRVAFAFDPVQRAILLTGGNKAGVAQKRFYRQLIDRADALFAAHLKAVREQKAGADKLASGRKKPKRQ